MRKVSYLAEAWSSFKIIAQNLNPLPASPASGGGERPAQRTPSPLTGRVGMGSQRATRIYDHLSLSSQFVAK
jgi:hypothetical protein